MYLLIFLNLPNNAFAAQKLLITNDLTYKPLGKNFDILKDRYGYFNINDVSAGKYNDRFTPGESDIYSKGFEPVVYWLRLEIDNEADRSTDIVLEMPVAWIDKVKIFLPFMGSSTTFFVAQSGSQLPYYQRSFPHRNHIFKFALPPGTKITAYIRVETDKAAVLPFFFWTAGAYYKHDLAMNILFVSVYTLILALMIFHLRSYYKKREKGRLYFVLHIFGWGLFLFSMNGDAYELLWPGYPYWGNRAPLIGALLTALFAGLFTKEFLRTKNRPKLNAAIYTGVGACAILIPYSLLWPDFREAFIPSAVFVLFAYSPLLFAAALHGFLKGERNAGYYLIAWPLPMLAVGIFYLACVNTIPFDFFAAHSVDLAALLELFILSQALETR